MIPVYPIPSARPRPIILARPLPTPIWDTEWLTTHLECVRLFSDHRLFSVVPPHGRREKTRADTNLSPSGAVPRGDRFFLSSLVLYPCTEGVEDLDAYRREVEHVRQTSTVTLVLGGFSPSGEVPLRDAMPNLPDLAFDRDGRREEGFDPDEAPDLRFRRGLSFTLRVGDDPHPLTIDQLEQVNVEVRAHDGVRRPVGVRAYLVGTYLSAIKG